MFMHMAGEYYGCSCIWLDNTIGVREYGRKYYGCSCKWPVKTVCVHPSDRRILWVFMGVAGEY